MSEIQLLQGDCLDQLKTLDDNSIDSIVTDPPYGLSFMGKAWDHSVPSAEVWAECLRVLKPGGHLLAFAGTRTQHRMAVNIEDAGFEIRNIIAWVYGSGFPKSQNVSKAIDKMGAIDTEKFKSELNDYVVKSGMTRSMINNACGFTMRFDIPYDKDPEGWGVSLPSPEKWNKICEVLNIQTNKWDSLIERKWRGRAGNVLNGNRSMSGVNYQRTEIEEPKTNEAKQWEGWGTALKPALEPITVARKPLTGTVAANVMEYGTGAINIDGCRVGSDGSHKRTYQPTNCSRSIYGEQSGFNPTNAEGRFPANLIHDGSDEVVGLFPDSKRQQGDVRGSEPSGVTDEIYGRFAGRVPSPKRSDSGSAARFFYCAKANKKDRNEGLDHIDPKSPANKGNGLQRVCSKCGITQRGDEVCQDEDNCPKEWVNPPKKNNHPTVKPTDLMCYLVRLVTPPNGTVLDPFMGSGSTGKACMVEGCDFIGIELDEEYIEIARARIESAKPDNTLNDFIDWD